MFRISLKSILGHKFRFLLTLAAVVLGVGFVVASFVIRDGLKETFNSLIEDINADTDVQVRGFVEFSESDFQDDPLIDETILAEVQSIEGVAEAIGGAGFGGIIPIRADGNPLESFGPPLLGFNYIDSALTPTRLVEGAPPERGEFVLDITTAEDKGFVIGERYDVVFPGGRESFTLSGLVSLGDGNATVGAVLTAYETSQFQELTDTVGRIQTISIRADPDVGATELAARIQAQLPDGVEAVTSDTVIEEGQADFGQIVDILGGVLTGFALVSLLVASFLISNIFNITIGQRVRELALLRAMGATTTQVRVSVLTEAGLIGLTAAALGIGFGAVVALGLRAALNAVGFGLPAFGINISAGTIITALIVAIGVTLLASLLPAFQAGRVPPVAAMHDGYQLPIRRKARRVLGGAMTSFGVLLMLVGLFGSTSGFGLIAVLGGGSVLVFVGITTLSPLFASPVVRTIGSPLRKFGFTGRLAQENAAGSAHKTASAAGALMIGLALVAAAGVVGASLKQSLSNTLDTSIQADFFIGQGGPGTGFGSSLARDLRATDEFDQVAAFRVGKMRVGGDTKDVFATNFDQLDGLIDPDVVSGSLSDAAPASILLHEDPASDLGASIGDPIVVEFASGGSTELTVAAIYTDALILGNWVIDIAVWDEYFSLDSDLFVAAKIADGVEISAAQQTLNALSVDFPQVDIQDQAEFQRSQENQVDSLLNVINMMLLFALVIALLGIAITMTLAVFERTREIGMLRAVGMTRKQARWMIIAESVLVALFGAALGLSVGVLFGWAAVSAIPDSVVNTFAIPWISLIFALVISAVIGVVAGLFPAWRAGRMNVLDAISHL
ncbi:MAG: ABC transporter permease [Actinobacteria bacterium]|nr:ABC transporter permease [Actinomycetota bacterium]